MVPTKEPEGGSQNKRRLLYRKRGRHHGPILEWMDAVLLDRRILARRGRSQDQKVFRKA